MAWYAHSLARGLLAAGHDVFMYAQAGSPLEEWCRKDGVPHNAEFNFHSSNPIELSAATRSLHKSIREFKPSILNPHCPPGHALLAWVNRDRKLPLVRAVAEPRAPKSNWINRRLHERHTDGIIYSTASSLPRYESVFKFDRQIEQVVSPGLDLTRFPSVVSENWRVKLHIPHHVIFAAIVARMSPEKGQELLIEALALLSPDERAQIVVLLTGDDNQQRTSEDLKKLAQSRGVSESLHFAPRLVDVRPLLSEIDLGIITSIRSEAVCRIALEYMAYSKPVISTDVNILPEVVQNGVNGWCVPVDNPEAIALALREVIKNRNELNHRGLQGRKLLEEHFTLERQTRLTIEYYEKVMNRHV